jgi:glycosyltransferase involved in cell wall biosynthesis
MIVMIVCHYDETNPTGGLEKQARLVSRRLAAAGEEVVMLGSTRSLRARRNFDDEGVTVRLFWTYASPQVSGRYLPAAILWAVQVFVWIALNRRRITVLHGHQIRIHAFAMALARRWFGIPTILKAATGGAGADIRAIGSRKYFGAPGRRFVIAHTDRFVATTDSIRQDYLAFGVDDSRIRVIPNGVVLLPGRPEPPADRFRRFLFLGRIAEDKHPVALAAAAVRVARLTDMSLDFYGEGDQLSELRQALARFGSDSVRYCGWTDDVPSILGRYGFLVLPSDAEGLSNAMIEACAQGVVPLATRVSGCIDHIVDGRNGFFLTGSGEDEIAEGLERAASVTVEEWSALSEQARTHALDRFAIGRVVEAYRDLYGSVGPNTMEWAR